MKSTKLKKGISATSCKESERGEKKFFWFILSFIHSFM